MERRTGWDSSEEKDKKIEDVKAAGLGLMKSVQTSAKTGSDEL